MTHPPKKEITQPWCEGCIHDGQLTCPVPPSNHIKELSYFQKAVKVTGCVHQQDYRDRTVPHINSYFAPLLECDCTTCKEAREAHDAAIRKEEREWIYTRLESVVETNVSDDIPYVKWSDIDCLFAELKGEL